MAVTNSVAIKEEGKKLGVEIIEVVADGDSNKQLRQIENFIAQKMDTIICAPAGYPADMEAVRHLKERLQVVVKSGEVPGVDFYRKGGVFFLQCCT